jgi:four helix bundle protein
MWQKFDRRAIGLQLVEAADSIGANIAEAAGRWHARERRQFFIYARASLYETEHWLSTAEERGLISGTLRERLDEIARTLGGLIDRHSPR